jgi:hypothetical protein
MEEQIAKIREVYPTEPENVRVRLGKHLWALSCGKGTIIAVCEVTPEKKLKTIGKLIGRDLVWG